MIEEYRQAVGCKKAADSPFSTVLIQSFVKGMIFLQQNINGQQENKMGTESVGRLIAGMALPAMFAMLIQALYNIVDSIYVAKLSQEALTAVSLAFPLQIGRAHV